MERPFAAYKGGDPYIFVSYAHDDAGVVYPELVRLKDAGFNIWYDEGISPGSTWRDEVALALTQCSLFLFFVTPRSVASQNCQQELNFCLSRERKMLCVHLDETVLPPGMELSLSDKQAIMRHHYENETFTQKLIDSLQESLPRGQEPISILKQEPVVAINPNERSIAVLPLENRSSDPENEYLTDGISEEIIGELSKIDGLRVASEIASFAFKGQTIELKAMGETLGVETVLSGSVRKSGSRFRVNILLNKVNDGSTLWSERYDGVFEDIFDLQDDVVRKVTDALKIELGAADRPIQGEKSTQNMEAYDAYLMGTYEGRKQSVQGWRKSLDLLRRAIALDPDFFDAYPKLVNALGWLSTQEGDPDGTLVAEAKSLHDRMVSLDPQKTHPAFGLVENNLLYMQSRRTFMLDIFAKTNTLDTIRHAEDYHENYVAGAYFNLADVCRCSGLYHGALELAEKYPEVKNRNPYIFAQCWASLGHFDKAIECCDEGIRMDPHAAAFRSDRCIWLARTGQYEQARQELDSLSAIWGPRHFPAFCFYYWRDEMQEARSCHDWLIERQRYDPYYKGVQLVMLGDLDSGIDYFEEALEGNSGVVGLTRVLNDTYLRPSQSEELYAHPRYADLMRQLGTHDDDQVKLIETINNLKPHTGIEVKLESEYAT